MAEEGTWVVHPNNENIAHYVIRWSSDSTFGARVRCNKKREVISWKPMKGHEEKCRTCGYCICMDNARPITLTDTTNAMKDCGRKWHREKKEGKR